MIEFLYYFIIMNKQYLEAVSHYTRQRSFSIHHTFVDDSTNCALYAHYHNEMEFLYLNEGKISFFVEGHKYEMRPGDAIFIPPGLVHSALKADGQTCDFDAVVFSAKWLWGDDTIEKNLYADKIETNRFDFICKLSSNEEQSEPVLDLLKGIGRYYDKEVTEYELRLKGELLICFQLLFNGIFNKLELTQENAMVETQLAPAIEYIHEHFDERLSLAKLSEVTGYSSSYFESQFKKLTGSTPFEYINRIRIINATDMLINNRDKVTIIALKCGFENISYFNRTFKKIIGKSPNEYRKDAL